MIPCRFFNYLDHHAQDYFLNYTFVSPGVDLVVLFAEGFFLEADSITTTLTQLIYREHHYSFYLLLICIGLPLSHHLQPILLHKALHLIRWIYPQLI